MRIMMSSLLLALSILAFACSNGERINNEDSTVKAIEISLDTLQLIKDIKKQYAEINTQTVKYDKVEKDIFGQSAEGGIMIAFYDKKDLRKIIATFYGETGQTTTEYYFDTKGELFFAFRKTFFYDKPMYVEDSRVQSVEEDKYYLFKNELIRWLGNKNKLVSPMSKEFQDESKHIKEDVKGLRKNIADYTP